MLGYPDHLIQEMLELFDASPDNIVLDPFRGTGTTLVECKKLGLASVGIDANPASSFASRAKTNWAVDPAALGQLTHEVLREVTPLANELLLGDTPLFARNGQLDTLKSSLLRDSVEGQYIAESGMLDRRWTDETPFYISTALLSCIKRLDADPDLVSLLRLALASCIVERVANVRFGPEIYVARGSGTHDVVGTFRSKVRSMAEDLARVQEIEFAGSTLVLQGDSRRCDELLRLAGIRRNPGQTRRAP